MKQYPFIPLFLALLAWHSLPANTIFVSATATGSNDGTSWPNAFPDLQSGLNAAQYGDTIWVAQGTYRPTNGTNRNLSFNLKNGVRIFGGFAGGEAQLSQRDWAAYPTVLSGDIGAVGDSTDNSFTVVFASTVDSSTVLDGFVVTGGNADSQVPAEPAQGRTKSGGGAYLIGNSSATESRPVFANCTFMGNYARNYGGGMYMKSGPLGNVSPSIIACNFNGNTAYNGGGLYKEGNGTKEDMAISYTNFSGNKAYYGGGLQFYNSTVGNKDLLIEHCIFEDNYAKLLGGAVSHEITNLKSKVIFFGCKFKRNLTPEGDGSAIRSENLTYSINHLSLEIDSSEFDSDTTANSIILVSDDSILLLRSVIKNCVTTSVSGMLEIGYSCWAKVLDCLFLNNHGSAIRAKLADLEVRNSVFDSNIAFNPGTAIWSTGDILSIAECKFLNNISMYPIEEDAGGAINCRNAVIQSSVFDSNSATYGGALYVDGKASIKNCVFSGNKATNDGGVFILANYASACFSGCTFFNNQSDGKGQVGWLYYYSDTISISNSIFWQHNASLDELFVFNNYGCTSLLSGQLIHSLTDATMCDSIASGWSGILYPFPYICPNPLTCGPGMRYNLDPMFLDTAAGDFRLHPCSPARNAGSNAAVDSLDLAGQPRIQGGTVDMGAHESPAFHAAAAVQLAPACGTAPGTLSLNLQHGCPPYFLDWGSGTAIADSSPAVLPLPAGQYSITVTDGRMEADTIAVEVTASPAISLGLSATPVQCSNATGGTATVTPAGGTGPFAYLWGNGDSTATVAGLPVGSYSVTVTDVVGCTAIASADITAEGQLQVGLGVMPISCHPANGPSGDGSATVQPIGGTAPYAWLWGNGATTPSLDSIGAGAYSATVTDALGCTGSTSFSMDGPPELLASIEADQPACHGDPGSGTAGATGGTPGYSYEWDNGALTAATSLLPGPHTVTVTDAKGCTDTAAIGITGPPPLAATASPVPPVLCHGASNGTLEVVPTGGTSPYSWTGGTQGLPPGDYNLMVTDANGCTALAAATILEHPPITVTDTVTDASSPTASDGAIEVIGAAGGAGAPYSFGWGTSDTTQSIGGLAPGSYSLTVTDPQGCTGGFVFTVGSANAAGGAGGHRFGAAIVPNPSGSSGAALRLERPVPGLRARVLDAKGGLVAELGAIAATTLELPKGLSAGRYTVALEAEGRRALLVWVVVE